MTASLNGDAKSIPIRCVIEVKSADKSCSESAGTGQADTESFAIVPSSSLFRDVVKTVLGKLGYSAQEASTAKGAVQIKNWKALDLEQVTDSEFVSVEDMLGDLANIATLRIQITSKPRSNDVKDKLLLLLLRQSYDVLIGKGCPITKDELEKVTEGRDEFSVDTQAAFNVWYNKIQTSSDEEKSQSANERNPSMNRTNFSALAPSNKTRIRISFSATEVAKLQHWFEMDPHPSRHAMTGFVAELNDLPPRGNGLKPLDLTNVMYWFKNARAAARRNGRSITSDDLSDDDGEAEKESTSSAPPLPNSNAVYVINDPLVTKNAEEKLQAPAADLTEESDMEEDLSVSDNESEINDTEPFLSSEKNLVDGAMEETDSNRQDAISGLSTSASSPKVSPSLINSVTPRLPGYPFPYGTFPMAYLQSSIQSSIHPFYKDWTEKVQSAVAQAHANTAQQNFNLMKPETIKAECELSKAERQKRHRAFIDPVSEIPKLEQWFTKDTHPSHYVIEQICDDLNRGEFRSRYPKLSPKNIQLWFKNHRAKVKRMRVGGGGLSFSGMDSSQMKMSPPSGLALSMMESV